MGLFNGLIYFIRQTPSCVAELLSTHPMVAYSLLFGVLACETASILFCFLPGDILIFILGGYIAKGDASFVILTPTLISGTVLGSMIGYYTGYLGQTLANKCLGEKIEASGTIQEAMKFYHEYGGVALIVSRFLPVLRSCMPMVCGLAGMPWRRFMLHNSLAAFIWVLPLLGLGYLAGEMPLVKDNLEWAMAFGFVLLAFMTGKEMVKKILGRE